MCQHDKLESREASSLLRASTVCQLADAGVNAARVCLDDLRISCSAGPALQDLIVTQVCLLHARLCAEVSHALKQFPLSAECQQWPRLMTGAEIRVT